MASTIMIGQVPVTIEGEVNRQTVGSSSGASNGQTSNSKEADQVPPTDHVYSNPSDVEETDDELEPKSSPENQDVNNDQDATRNAPKRKRYHRHTAHQIQEMEAFFKECPHPDDRQRKELSRALGLQPLQVKFWFQNKRTQIKSQSERVENAQLKAHNDRLRAENMSFREALARGACPGCGGLPAVAHSPIEANELRLENARLREEIERITAIAAQFVGNPFASQNHNVVPVPNPPVIVDSSANIVEPADVGAFGGQGQPEVEGDLVFEEELIMSFDAPPPNNVDQRRIIELASFGMDELNQKAQLEFPLWVPSIDQRNFVLNEEVYYEMFPRAADVITPPSFKVEATRHTEIIMMDPLHLVDVLMDMEKFLAVFASIVSKGIILDVIPAGSAENHDQISLLLLSAEYQVLTPTVPTRESMFVRHCRKLAEDTWGVVDVSSDNVYGTGTFPNCHRMPSGCIIQAVPNGGSKVTWIEHVEAEDRGVHHLGKPFVDSRLAFGAQRWLAVLARQCERLASVAVINFPYNDINNTDPKTRRDILKLAERMVISFCGGVTSSTAYSWLKQTGNGGEEVRIMTKTLQTGPEKPSETILSATTSFWLPVPHKLVFEFLRDENTRKEWDVLARTGEIQEFVHITNGHEVGNCVSMFRVSGTNTGHDMVILQECSSDPTASCVIYAPLDPQAAKKLLADGMADNVELLPSGFTIYPSERPSPPTTLMNPGPIVTGAGAITPGSLVTVAFQVLVDPSHSTSMFSFGSVAVINNLIESTVQRIKSALS